MKRPNDDIRWGILGTGDIARQFAEDLRHVAGTRLQAVGSRRQETADRFGDRHHIPTRHASYAALAADPEVDAVYIATPHSRHREDTLLCIEQGKAVLCEKPFAVNYAEAVEMVEAARERQVFLMEALWTRFFPAIQAAMRAVAEGAIGVPQLVRADFSYQAPYSPDSRLFDPELAGGALLDIGVYPLALAGMVLGYEPDSILSDVTFSPSGVDESAAITLCYRTGARAILSCSLRLDAPQEAIIVGDAGYIRLPHRFYQPDTFVLCQGSTETLHRYTRKGYGYHFQIEEVVRGLRAGHTECAVAPLDETLELANLLTRIREQWGLQYPFERADTQQAAPRL